MNGLFADLQSWERALPYLTGFQLLRYDGRGQGLSDKPLGPYTLDDMVGDLEELLDQLNMPPAFFVGISNGGCIALEFTRRHPEKVRGLIAADCYDRVTPLLRLKIQSWLRAHEVGGPLHRFDVATPWIWSESLLQANPDLVAFYRNKAGEQHENAVRGLLEGSLTHAIAIEEITVPTLLLVGVEDILTPPFLMAAMRDKMPGAHLTRVAGGHASLLEHPEIFGETIIPFIKDLTHVD